MASKEMAYFNVGNDEFEIVDDAGRQATSAVDEKVDAVDEKVDGLSASNLPYSDTQSTKQKIDEKASLTQIASILEYDTSHLTGDLNTLTTEGIYRVANIKGQANFPAGIGSSGFIWVVKIATYIMQWAICDSGQKHRFSYDNASTWNNWV